MARNKSNLEKLFLRETKASSAALKAAQKEHQKVLKKFVIENITGQGNFKDFYSESYWALRDDVSNFPQDVISESETLEFAIHERIFAIEDCEFEDIAPY